MTSPRSVSQRCRRDVLCVTPLRMQARTTPIASPRTCRTNSRLRMYVALQPARLARLRDFVVVVDDQGGAAS